MKLNNTIERLTKKPTNSVTIINMDTAERVSCNLTGKTIMEEYGTVDNYFENLYKKGITKIKVADRNPHGTTTTPCGEPYTVSLIPSGDEPPAEKPIEVRTNVVQTTPPLGLSGGLEGLGLTGAQVEVAGKLFKYPELVSDLQQYKSKVEVLEKENGELQRKLDRIETLDEKGERSANANTNTLSMAKELVKELAPVLMSFKGGGNTPAPALAGSLDPVVQETLKSLMQYDQPTIKIIGKFADKLNLDAVWNDFDALLTKHNIS